MALDIPSDSEPLSPDWFAPLLLVAAQQVGQRLGHFLAVEDFTVTARVLRPPRPTVVLYKHTFTGADLNLDDVGHAYRYVPVRGSSRGRYDPQPLERALRVLRLDELPWLKQGLEGEQRGLPWEARGSLRLALDREYTERGRPPPDERPEPRRSGGRRRRGLVLVASGGTGGGPRRGDLHVV